MNIGNVESNIRGSGARNNAGKPPMHLIPYTLIANSYDISSLDPEKKMVQSLLYHSGLFQQTGHVVYLEDALKVAKNYWADCAEVFGYGANKYAEYNWCKGMKWSVPLGCIGRHCLKVLSLNEMTDDESGLSHIGHIMCNLVMLETFILSFPEGNDLPPANFTVTLKKETT